MKNSVLTAPAWTDCMCNFPRKLLKKVMWSRFLCFFVVSWAWWPTPGSSSENRGNRPQNELEIKAQIDLKIEAWLAPNSHTPDTVVRRSEGAFLCPSGGIRSGGKLKK